MTELEGTPDDFARMFGRQPGPEQSESEPDSTEVEAEAEAKPEASDTTEQDPARAHSEFLAALFRGSPAKQEADERFFRAMHPPTKEGDE